MVNIIAPRVDDAYIMQLRAKCEKPTTKAVDTKMSSGDDIVNTSFLKGNYNSNRRDLNNQLTGTSTDDYGYPLCPNESAYQLPAIPTPTPVSKKSPSHHSLENLLPKMWALKWNIYNSGDC